MNSIIKTIFLLCIINLINAADYNTFTFKYGQNNYGGCDSSIVYNVAIDTCTTIKCKSSSPEEKVGIRFEDGQYHAVFYTSGSPCVTPATLGIAYDEAYFDCLPNNSPVVYGPDYIFTCGN